MMAWLLLKADGTVAGASPYQFDLTQAAYAGMSQVEADDADPRVLAARAATPKARPSPREWLERLAPATQAAITKAAAADATGGMLLWLLKAAGNPAIDVTSAETVAGVQAMVSAGVITAADQTTLLTP
ncbi:MAG TPA: hypothetical protein VF930_05825 [Stellaceae bacterium]